LAQDELHSRAEPDAPIYRRISDRLAERIRSGEWSPGRQFPSERELAEKFGASRMTVRQALRVLAEQGLIETRTGRGSFVGRKRIEEPLSTLHGFTEQMRKNGLRTSSIVLCAGPARADAAAGSALGLGEGAAVHRLVRVRLVEGEPVALETTEIPTAVLPDLFDLADFSRQSLYATLRGQGVTPVEAEQTLAAGLPDRATALALKIGAGTPVLNLTRRTFDGARRPIEFVRSAYRGDTFVMTVHLRLAQ